MKKKIKGQTVSDSLKNLFPEVYFQIGQNLQKITKQAYLKQIATELSTINSCNHN